MRRSVAVLLGALLAGLAATAPALADQAQSAVVSADPVDFTPHVLDGTVRAIAVVGDTVVVAGPWLYAGGTFTRVGGVSRAGLARLSTATGAVDQGLDLHLAAPDFPRPRVEDLAVSPDGTRLVAIGVIEQALGQHRAQLLVADAAANPVRLADWY